MVTGENWQNLVGRIKSAWRRQAAHGDCSDLFEWIFLGQESEKLKGALAEYTGKVMVVAGGADDVVKLERIAKIEPAKQGLHLLKVPGLGHFLSLDPRWDQWLEIALEAVLRFDLESGVNRWTAQRR